MIELFLFIIIILLGLIAWFLYTEGRGPGLLSGSPRSDGNEADIKSYDQLVKKAVAEVNEFTSMLENMDSREIAYMLIWATQVRKELEREGHDLLNPLSYCNQNPEFLSQLREVGVAVHQQGNVDQVWAIAVWHNTLKAASFAEARGAGRKLWTELARGMADVESMLPEAQRTASVELDVSGYDRIPEGFSPSPE